MKKHQLQFYLILLCSVYMMTLMVYASEDRNKITQIPLTFEYTIETGSSQADITVSCNSQEYALDYLEFVNEDEDWKSGDRPRVKIYLTANDSYYFSTSAKSAFTFYGDEASFVSASIRDSKETLVLTVKLARLKSDDLSISELWWDGDSGFACWDEHKDARQYEVRLYRNGTSVTSARTVRDNTYDFSRDISRSGDYSFRVRVVDHDSKKGSWEESEEWYVSNSMAKDFDSSSSSSSSGSGGPGGSSGSTSGGPGVSGSSTPSRSNSYWCLDHIGWWYQHSDGSYATNQWLLINQKWYFFDHTGYMKTGWILWNNIWYYCDASGAMWENTRTPDGYWVDASGAWVQGY